MRRMWNAPTRTRRRRVAAALAALALVFAAVAWAVLSSKEETATDTITAKSVGQVDIGNAAEVGLFSGEEDLSDVEPGWSVSDCTTAKVTDAGTGEVPKFYFTGTGGELADDLIVTISANTGATTPAGNSELCGTGTTPLLAADTTLSELLAAHGSYATGFDWATADSTQIQVTLRLLSTTDPQAVAGQSASFAGVFENRSP